MLTVMVNRSEFIWHEACTSAERSGLPCDRVFMSPASSHIPHAHANYREWLLQRCNDTANSASKLGCYSNDERDRLVPST